LLFLCRARKTGQQRQGSLSGRKTLLIKLFVIFERMHRADGGINRECRHTTSMRAGGQHQLRSSGSKFTVDSVGPGSRIRTISAGDGKKVAR
jgi:hypothetical protein